MGKYINKAALVAEIENRIKEIEEIGTYLSPKGTLTNLLCYINALEVKEVDLEQEFCNYTKNIWACDVQKAPFTKMYNCAKHFFELGISAQKGE